MKRGNLFAFLGACVCAVGVDADRFSSLLGERGRASSSGMPSCYETGIRQRKKTKNAADTVQLLCANGRDRTASLLVLPRVTLGQCPEREGQNDGRDHARTDGRKHYAVRRLRRGARSCGVCREGRYVHRMDVYRPVLLSWAVAQLPLMARPRGNLRRPTSSCRNTNIYGFARQGDACRQNWTRRSRA